MISCLYQSVQILQTENWLIPTVDQFLLLFFFFSPNPSYGFKVKALDIRFVKCEMSDIMVDAFVKFS